MFKFITRKHFLVNLLAALVLFALIVYMFLFSLDWITHHGKTAKVPSITGKPVAEAKKLLESAGFEVKVQDSVYYDSIPRYTVIKQFPLGDEIVKESRIIYLTVNRAVPPMVEMPNLVGLTLRHAEIVLSQHGLKLGDTTFKPDFAVRTILEQAFKGTQIKPGTKLPKSSKVDLVVSSGLGNTEMPVPDLVGLTYTEAMSILEAQGLLKGAVTLNPGMTDSTSGYVWKQFPPRINDFKDMNYIRQGNTMDIWVGPTMPVADSMNAPADNKPVKKSQPKPAPKPATN